MKKLGKLLSLFLFLVSGGYAQASAVDMRAAIDAQLRSNGAKHSARVKTQREGQALNLKGKCLLMRVNKRT